MRVLVCGGRDYSDAGRDYSAVLKLYKVLREANITTLIQGGAKGADFYAKWWAIDRGIPVEEYSADWSLGRKAGPLRNKRMLEEGKPDLVIAFPGGKGTANMIKLAEDAGVKVHLVS